MTEIPVAFVPRAFFTGRIAMPFSRQNIRFTVLVIGFVALCIILVAAVGDTAKTALVTMGGIQFLTMMRQELIAREQRHDIRNEMQATSAKVQLAAEEVKHATNGELDKRIECAVQKALQVALPGIIEQCRCKSPSCEPPRVQT